MASEETGSTLACIIITFLFLCPIWQCLLSEIVSLSLKEQFHLQKNWRQEGAQNKMIVYCRFTSISAWTQTLILKKQNEL